MYSQYRRHESISFSMLKFVVPTTAGELGEGDLTGCPYSWRGGLPSNLPSPPMKDPIARSCNPAPHERSHC